MFKKNISNDQQITVSYKILNKFRNFLSKHYKDTPIERTGEVLIKSIIYQDTDMSTLAYFIALIRLENHFRSETHFDQSLGKALKVDNFLNYQQLRDFSDSSEDLNYLRSLALFQGWEINFSISLLKQTLKSLSWDYIRSLADELARDPNNNEAIQELALVLETEINAQENDFGYDKFSQDRSLQLHFEKLSFFLVIKRLMLEPEEGLLEPAGFAVHYCFLDANNQGFCINRRMELEEDTESRDIIFDGSTNEVLIFLLENPDFQKEFIKLILEL